MVSRAGARVLLGDEIISQRQEFRSCTEHKNKGLREDQTASSPITKSREPRTFACEIRRRAQSVKPEPKGALEKVQRVGKQFSWRSGTSANFHTA